MIELEIQGLTAEGVEELSDLLTNLGALAMTYFDAEDCPVLEPAPGETPLWPKVSLKALFQDSLQGMLCEKVISNTYPDLHIQSRPIQDRIWEEEWKSQAQAMCFGHRLRVRPSHLPALSDTTDVILDPGLAFGTGSHPTTSLCLKWLDRHPLDNQVVLDYGCGTGILMIAALKLGAQYAYGVDIDPQALTATIQNAELNDISPTSYQVSDVESFHPTQPVDVILANILLNPLLLLKATFAQLLKPSGLLVVSGILIEQIPYLTQAYAEIFELLETHTDEQWAILILKVK